MNDDLLRNNPYWLITLLASHLKHGVAHVAEAHDLTPSQMQALLLLKPGVQIPMNQLSCMISCDASYITSIVDKLSALSYIRRQESALDRRIKTIELTKNGATFRSKLIADFSDYATEESSLQNISSADISTLRALVEVIDIQQPKK